MPPPVDYDRYSLADLDDPAFNARVAADHVVSRLQSMQPSADPCVAQTLWESCSFLPSELAELIASFSASNTRLVNLVNSNTDSEGAVATLLDPIRGRWRYASTENRPLFSVALVSFGAIPGHRYRARFSVSRGSRGLLHVGFVQTRSFAQKWFESRGHRAPGSSVDSWAALCGAAAVGGPSSCTSPASPSASTNSQAGASRPIAPTTGPSDRWCLGHRGRWGSVGPSRVRHLCPTLCSTSLTIDFVVPASGVNPVTVLKLGTAPEVHAVSTTRPLPDDEIAAGLERPGSAAADPDQLLTGEAGTPSSGRDRELASVDSFSLALSLNCIGHIELESVEELSGADDKEFLRIADHVVGRTHDASRGCLCCENLVLPVASLSPSEPSTAGHASSGHSGAAGGSSCASVASPSSSLGSLRRSLGNALAGAPSPPVPALNGSIIEDGRDVICKLGDKLQRELRRQSPGGVMRLPLGLPLTPQDGGPFLSLDLPSDLSSPQLDEEEPDLMSAQEIIESAESIDLRPGRWPRWSMLVAGCRGTTV